MKRDIPSFSILRQQYCRIYVWQRIALTKVKTDELYYCFILKLINSTINLLLKKFVKIAHPMRKSPNLKENCKIVYNKPAYLSSKTKQKTSSLEKSSCSNRSLLSDLHLQTPNQPKKNITTQASDQKLNAQNQILKSLMKIQTRTNPSHYPGVKLNFNNCLLDDRKIQKTQSSTAHPSPKTKAVSLSTYTSTQSPELRERDVRYEKVQSFKVLLHQTRACLETVRINEMTHRIEKIFDSTIQPLIKMKNEALKQIEKCLSAEAYQIKATIDSLQKMEDDIKCHEYNIIETMQMGPFNDIMSIYQRKFKEHTIFTQQLASQDLVITQMQQLHESFATQASTLVRQLNQSLQTYLSLYISFQNKDDFMPQLEGHGHGHGHAKPTLTNYSPSADQLFQTCETNNSIDEDQVIIRENQQTIRLPDKTSKFTQLLMKEMCCHNNSHPSESPQFKN